MASERQRVAGEWGDEVGVAATDEGVSGRALVNLVVLVRLRKDLACRKVDTTRECLSLKVHADQQHVRVGFERRSLDVVPVLGMGCRWSLSGDTWVEDRGGVVRHGR